MFDSEDPVSPEGARLFLTNLNTGRTRPFSQFPAPGSPPVGNDYIAGLVAFSPDSRAIAFDFLTGAPSKGAAAGVVFMSVATGHTIRSITVRGVGAGGPPFLWLPNGRLLFQVGFTELATVSKTGTGLRPIKINVPADQINEVVASPDGSQLAIETQTGDGCDQDGPCTYKLFVAPTAGGTARWLAPSTDLAPVWSPDGKYLLDRAGIDRAGTKMELITVATGHAITIGSPGGTLVGWRPVTGPR